MTQSQTEISLVRAATPKWRTWLLLWIPVLLCLATLLSFNAALDTYLWNATRWAVGDGQYYKWADFHAAHAADEHPAFFMTDDPPLGSNFYRRTERLWYTFKWGGEAWMTAIIVVIAFGYSRKPLVAAAAIAATAIPGILSFLIRIVDGRYRPTHHDGQNTWVFLRIFYDGTDLSFPSGHATLAFANAAVLGYLFPRARPLFLLLAACTAISRVVQEAHFWSDILLGAALGWTLGWITMQFADRNWKPAPHNKRIESNDVPNSQHTMTH